MTAANPSCPYTIEPANWRDLNQVRQLENICFPKDAWPIWDLVGVLTLPNVIRLKAVCQGKIIGFIAGDIRNSENVSWIATVGVLPEYRSQGVGRAIMEACEAQLPSSTVRLCVRPSNRNAIRLYENLGYHSIDNWSRYYSDGEDALIMEKRRFP
jgi:ribosomal protein S18 acetylase RimI-like enzyme